MPSDTFYTVPPEWTWYIILYFFLGGIAGGCYFVGALIDLLGKPEDRPLARLAYYISLPLVAISGLLLTVDLGQPLRFWHMLLQNHTFRPMFKDYAPLSFGAWALMGLGLFSFLSVVAALAEAGRLPFLAGFNRVWRSGITGHIFTGLGTIFGLFIAGYTGVLLTVTNQPLWADTNLIGLVFVASAASTAIATLILVGVFGLGRRVAPALLDRLEWLENWAMGIELITAILMVITLGSVAQLLAGWYGVALALALILGAAIPLALRLIPGVGTRIGRTGTLGMAALILVGGFLLRYAIVMSANAPHGGS